MEKSHRQLWEAALAARQHAHAAFSNFKVGAALETTDGLIMTGCNVENATYGLTICAERVAVFKAVSEGMRRDVLACYPSVEPSRVRVIHNGVDTDEYRPDPSTDELRRLGLGAVALSDGGGQRAYSG